MFAFCLWSLKTSAVPRADLRYPLLYLPKRYKTAPRLHQKYFDICATCLLTKCSSKNISACDQFVINLSYSQGSKHTTDVCRPEQRTECPVCVSNPMNDNGNFYETKYKLNQLNVN